MEIKEQIDDLKLKNPTVDANDLDDLVKSVAKYCMDSIVQSIEKKNDAGNAWWTIRSEFEVGELNEKDYLPNERSLTYEHMEMLRKACLNEDIDKLKEYFSNGAMIVSIDGKGHIELDVIELCAEHEKIKALDFFLNNNLIQNNDLYRKQIDFRHNDDYLFKHLFMEKKLASIEYFILHHDLETYQGIRDFVRESDDLHMKSEVIKIIERKYLNATLSLSLESSPNNSKKPKL